MTQESYEERLKTWEKARFAPPPLPERTPAEPTLIEMAPMRDGVRLYTEVFLPATKGRFPVVLTRSPYAFNSPAWNDRRPLSRYFDAGYAVVFQMCRGQHKSEGVYRYLLDDVADGYDCINWVAGQDWCDGNIGMEGGSYNGRTQILAARARPEALKCITPTCLQGDFGTCFPYTQGIPMRGVYMQWNKNLKVESMEDLDAPYGDMSILQHPIWGPALRKRPLIDAADGVLDGDWLASWRETLSHPLADDYWKPVDFTDDELAALDLPMFFTDGWADATIGPIDYFNRLERAQPGQADRYLLVGPWEHSQTYLSCLHDDRDHGERKMPVNGGADLEGLRLAFFDRYLRGDETAQIQSDRVRVFITGVDEWRDYPTFPAPGTEERKLYLHSHGDARSFQGDGVLSWEVPVDETADSYVYDPTLPTPSISSNLPFTDHRDLEIRSDVLSYTSAPLETPLTILGEIVLELHAASDGPDTDWFAYLTEVFPDGRSVPFHCSVCSGLRARYREGYDREVLLTPNEPTKFRILMGPAGHHLTSGARLRLSICSASFPQFDTNTNTGNPVLTDTAVRVAKQTVFHDATRPSHIIIPVIDL